MENPIYNDVDKTFNDFISPFNKIFGLYLIKCDFEVKFINFDFINFIKKQSIFSIHLWLIGRIFYYILFLKLFQMDLYFLIPTK